MSDFVDIASHLEADGQCAWLENNFIEAQRCFDEAIALLPARTPQTMRLKTRLYCGLTQTLLSQGKAYSALRCAEQAVSWDATTEGRFLRARAICAMEKRDEMYYEEEEEREEYLAKALTDLCAVIRLEPTNMYGRK